MENSSEPVSRPQKIVNHLFPFFGDLAQQHRSDFRALSICKSLLALEGAALQAPVIKPLLKTWHDECPEEYPLEEHELKWALLELESHLSRQLHELNDRMLDEVGRKPRKPKLRLIQGGMPAKPPKREL